MGTGIGHFIPLVAYLGFWVMCIVSLTGRPILGLYYMMPFLPYRTMRNHFLEWPLGANVLTILVLSVIVGALLHGKESSEIQDIYHLACFWSVLVLFHVVRSAERQCASSAMALRRELRHVERLHADSAGVSCRGLSNRRPKVCSDGRHTRRVSRFCSSIEAAYWRA